MSDKYCKACDDLQEYAPDFVQNGVTEKVCTSLKNDTGLGTNANHNDCDDLQDANDCLIGQLGETIDAYDTCDWKEYMKKLMPNLYNLLSAIICAICGIWTNIHNLWNKVNCILNALKKLVVALQDTSKFEPTVSYARFTEVSEPLYYAAATSRQTINFNSANSGTNRGSFYAPSDCVAIVSCCADMQNKPGSGEQGEHITFYSSSESFNDRLMEERSIHFGNVDYDFSITVTKPIKMKKGDYLKVNVTPYGSSGGRFRLHQFAVCFIPVWQLGLSTSDIGLDKC